MQSFQIKQEQISNRRRSDSGRRNPDRDTQEDVRRDAAVIVHVRRMPAYWAELFKAKQGTADDPIVELEASSKLAITRDINIHQVLSFQY